MYQSAVTEAVSVQRTAAPVSITRLDSISANVKQDDSNNDVAASGCGEQIGDILDGLVSAMIGGFESAVWAMLRAWSVEEAAVGNWSAQPSAGERNERREW